MNANTKRVVLWAGIGTVVVIASALALRPRPVLVDLAVDFLQGI